MHANPIELGEAQTKVGLITKPTLSYVTWNSTSFPLPKGSKKRSVMAATMAQKKLYRELGKNHFESSAYTHLLHMTFAGKKYDTSSRLNRTPPTGAPNATATPAAQAALRMPRRFPVHSTQLVKTAY